MKSKLLIVTPAPLGSTKGNRITAERWGRFLTQLGHRVELGSELRDGDFDALITLHATRSHDVINEFRAHHPGKPVILCITGTDLHLDLQGQRGADAQRLAGAAITACDRLVLLEPEGCKQLPESAQSKASVIRQSATAVLSPPARLPNVFEVSVIGHLRDEKDPFLAARASRSLPEASTLTITHLGAALSAEMERAASEETLRNARYQWIGELTHDETQQLLARSQLMILSSKVEGAPSVISEAIVNRIPILSTEIPAARGLLGDRYPGLFPVADFAELAKLMWQAESEPAFLTELSAALASIADAFSPEHERDALGALVESTLAQT